MRIVCYAHTQAPTVTVCSDCRRGLCRRCDELVRPPLCAECIERRAHALRSQVARQATCAILLSGAVAWGINKLLHLPLWVGIAIGYLTGSAFYGADLVRRHLPARLLALPILGQAIHGALLLVSSVIVGTFTVPFLLTKGFLDVQRLQRMFSVVRRSLQPPAQSRILSVRVEPPAESS